LAWFLNHACADRIQNHVATKLKKIAVAIDKNGFVPSLIDVAHPVVPPVEILGIGAIDVPHPLGETSFGRFHHQVAVVFHQAIRMTEPVESLDRILEDF